MIELLPNILNSNDVDSPGELILYELFKKFQLKKDWIVYHSLEITKHVRQKSGQADFVVIIPKKGVIVIEVKHSLEVNRRDGVWYLSGCDPSTKSPFTQAKENSESLRRIVSKEMPLCSNILFTHLVVFTRNDFDEKSPSEWERWQFINSNQLNFCLNDHSIFFKLFENVITSALEKGSLSKTIKEGSPDIHQLKLLKKIRKDFSPILTPKERSRKLQESLLKTFTDNQLDTLDKIDGNKKIVLMGPAGTGKTLLAIEMARRNVSKKIKTLFLCKNKKIYEHIKLSIDPIIGEFLTFLTIDKFLMKETGISIPGNFIDRRKFFRDLPNQLLDNLIKNKSDKQDFYDCLIIDEAQIILTEEYIDIFDLIVKGGLNKGNYIFFGDFYGQALAYSFESRQIELDEFTERHNFMCYKISENCRNTEKITNFSAYACKTDPYNKVFRIDSPTDYDLNLKYENNFEQLHKLAEILNKLINEKVELSQIIILTIKNESVSCIREIPSLFNHIENESNKLKKVLMPIETTVWLIENTALDFNQIANFCDLDLFTVNEIADENIHKNINGMSPIKNNQLTQLEIDRCTNDKNQELKLSENISEIKIDKDKLKILKNIGIQNGIEFSTCRKYIGMEKSTVILCDINDISDPINRSLLHIGITRTLDRLYVLSYKSVKFGE